VSILTRITGQHLDDAALAEIWTNAVADGSRAAHPHLDVCAECRLRFASLMAWLEEVRTDAFADADAAFPPERLAAQHAQVLRRLEAAERPTRVILFPKTPVQPPRPTSVRRWVAAAAAAGLFITGLGLGQLMNLGDLRGTRSTFPADRVPESNRAAAITPGLVPVSLNDDIAFPEFDELSMPRYEALRAFDTFTPRAADLLQTAR